MRILSHVGNTTAPMPASKILEEVDLSMGRNLPDHPHEPPADAEYPSTLRITSTPFEEHTESALDRAERWEQGEAVPHVVNFQDASDSSAFSRRAAWS